jgi:hypothetical protein
VPLFCIYELLLPKHSHRDARARGLFRTCAPQPARDARRPATIAFNRPRMRGFVHAIFLCIGIHRVDMRAAGAFADRSFT